MRRIALLIGLGALLITVGMAAGFAWLWTGAAQTNEGVEFVNRLRIPPLAEPRVEPDGTKTFALELRGGRTELLPGTETETWGVNGPYLGPTLRAERGDRVRVEVANRLPEVDDAALARDAPPGRRRRRPAPDDRARSDLAPELAPLAWRALIARRSADVGQRGAAEARAAIASSTTAAIRSAGAG